MQLLQGASYSSRGGEPASEGSLCNSMTLLHKAQLFLSSCFLPPFPLQCTFLELGDGQPQAELPALPVQGTEVSELLWCELPSPSEAKAVPGMAKEKSS